MVVVDGTITSSVVAFGFIVVVAVLVDVVVVALSVAFIIVALSVVLVNGDVVGSVVVLLSTVLLVFAAVAGISAASVVAAISTDIPVASGTSVCGRSKNSPTCSATICFNICHSAHLNVFNVRTRSYTCAIQESAYLKCHLL